MPLESIANLDCLVVRSLAEGRDHAVGRDAFQGLDVAGKAVLVETGWSRYWRTEAYAEGHAFLTGEAAEALKEAGARLVGIDSLNIDDTRTGARPVHSILLRNEIPVVEHLTNLAAVPDTGARFFAVPPKMVRVGTFSVRAFALIP